MGLLRTLLTALILVSLSVPSGAQVFLRDIPAPSSSSATVTWDGEAFWVGDNTSTVYRISEANGAVLRTLTAPSVGTDGLAWDGEYLWIVSGNNNDHTIYKVDTTDGSVVSTIPDMADGWTGGVTFGETQLWASRRFPTDQIIAIDSANGNIGTTYPAPGGEPWGMTYDGAMLWVSAETDTGDCIYRVDPADGAVVWGFRLPNHTSLPDRRVRGLTWVDGSLWFVGFQQSTFTISLHEYDVSNAIQPDISIDIPSHEFGAHVVGFPVTWDALVNNVGNVPLVVTGAAFEDGTGFSLLTPTSFPFEINSFEPATFTIKFDPPTDGDYEDALLISTNDPDEPVAEIAISGTAYPDEGDITAIPNALNFGTVWIPSPNLSSSRTLELHNLGAGVLTISDLEITVGDYFTVDPIALPAAIDSQSYLRVRVWFDPELTGFWNGTLTITSDDPDQNLLDIQLSGQAETAFFEAGDEIWSYWGATDDWDNGVNAANWINDVNGDGTPDVIASLGNGLTYCLNGAGAGTGDTLWSFDTRADPNHSGAVWDEHALSSIADITGDGIDDVVLGTVGGSRSIYALSGETGEQLWMFDTHGVWDDGGWIYAVAPTADLNSDFVNDVLVAGGTGGTGGPRRIFALSGINGALIWQGPQETSNSYYSVLPISDVTGDGVPEAIGGTSGYLRGFNGANGSQLWQRNINGDAISSSPVFEFVNMGNANPDVNLSEDLAVASAYDGIWCVDGVTGLMIWRFPIDDFVYEVCAGSDITGDDVHEVYAGTVGGLLICLDGALGTSIWQVVADPGSAENILSMTNIPDITGDQIDDIICGTLGDILVVRSGWDGAEYFSTTGPGPVAAVDAVAAMPDIDENGSFEVIAGNREGLVMVLAGGAGIPGPSGRVIGTVTSTGGSALSGVSVSAVGTSYNTFTNENGDYTLVTPPGEYSVLCSRPGNCDELFDVTVVENVELTHDVTMGSLDAHFSATSINIIVPRNTPRSEIFEISNPEGECDLTYTITVSDNWMNLSPASGTVPPGEVDAITVNLNTSRPAGEYQGQITITHDDLGSPHVITVSLNIITDAESADLLPTKFELYAAYPNPFNPSTSIDYDLARETEVRISVYDALGREVRELVDSRQARGAYTIVWNGESQSGEAVSTGMYFVRLSSSEFTATRKVLLMK